MFIPGVDAPLEELLCFVSRHLSLSNRFVGGPTDYMRDAVRLLLY